MRNQKRNRRRLRRIVRRLVSCVALKSLQVDRFVVLEGLASPHVLNTEKILMSGPEISDIEGTSRTFPTMFKTIKVPSPIICGISLQETSNIARIYETVMSLDNFPN